MEDDRIDRLARALCRAARLDPDKPIDRTDTRFHHPDRGIAAPVAAWTLFRRTAEHVVAGTGPEPDAAYRPAPVGESAGLRNAGAFA